MLRNSFKYENRNKNKVLTWTSRLLDNEHNGDFEHLEENYEEQFLKTKHYEVSEK